LDLGFSFNYFNTSLYFKNFILNIINVIVSYFNKDFIKTNWVFNVESFRDLNSYFEVLYHSFTTTMDFKEQYYILGFITNNFISCLANY
jgi:hypothetical protein